MASVSGCDLRWAITLFLISVGSWPESIIWSPKSTPSASAYPWQRSTETGLVKKWLTHKNFVAPAAFALLPAPKPASYSGWPICANAPSISDCSRVPELIVTTGIPLAIAEVIGPFRTS